MQMAYCCTKCSLIRDGYLESDLLRRPIKNLEARLDICMIFKDSGTVYMLYLEIFIRGKGKNCTTFTSMS